MTTLDVFAFLIVGIAIVIGVWNLARSDWEVITLMVGGAALFWAVLRTIAFFSAKVPL